MGNDLPRRLARHYNLSLHQAKFLAMLVLYECVTAHRAYEELRTTECRRLAFCVRNAIPSLTIHSRRFVGYWLTPEDRGALARAFGVTIPDDHNFKVSDENLSCWPDDRASSV